MPASPTVLPDLAKVSEWYRSEARDLPWRRADFHRTYAAWGTLVSEFMLQQTPVARVIPHLDAWLHRWPTPISMASASPAEVVTQWANLGYPRRALWLHGAAIVVSERHDGVVPRDVADLLALPGIGDYTARAVAVFAYGDRHPVVDTNTRRVLARVIDGAAQPGPPSRRDLETMRELLPDENAESALFNAAVMELGAVVCTARAPKCEQCPVRDACRWFALGRPAGEDTRRRQAKYEGSDRQARGAVLQTLRLAPTAGVPLDDVISDWPDAAQRHRAIDSLIVDGLAEAHDGLLSLPR